MSDQSWEDRCHYVNEVAWPGIHAAWAESEAKPFADPGPSWEERSILKMLVDVLLVLDDWIKLYRALPPARFRTEPMVEISKFIIASIDWYFKARAECYGAGFQATGIPWGLDPAAPTDDFEAWLLARWLRDIRSDEFRGSVQHERLMAEWERGSSI